MHRNGVRITPISEDGTPFEDDRAAVLVPFKSLDDFHRTSSWKDPVGQILKALEPFLLEMDEAYVAANTPPAPDPDVELTEEVKE